MKSLKFNFDDIVHEIEGHIATVHYNSLFNANSSLASHSTVFKASVSNPLLQEYVRLENNHTNIQINKNDVRSL